MKNTDEESKWTPESLFLPSKKFSNGTDGEWCGDVDGVYTRRIYKDGKLFSSEPAINKWKEEK